LVNSASDVEIARYVRKYRRGMVNSLLEYLILNYLEKEKLCGYDIITLLHERFHTLLSPGQVYPVIDCMADQGMICKQKCGRAIMLAPSHLGVSLLRAWREEFHNIKIQVENLTVEELPAVS
jgi:DNA-binding PadR family transcriptional regulator